MKFLTTSLLVSAIALGVVAPLFAQDSPIPKKAQMAAKGKVVKLDRTAGEHTVEVHVGDVLTFDMTTGVNASTGYHWMGPDLDGSVFGRISTETVRAKNYEKLKRQYEKKPPMPGAPGPKLETTTAKLKVSKEGTCKVTFRLGRTTADGKPQDGDTICVYIIKSAAK